jgi:hypothetical protein
MGKDYKGYYVDRESGIATLLILWGAHSKPILITNDETILKGRIREIEEDVSKAKNRREVIIALYRWAGDHGPVRLMTPKDDARGVLKILPYGTEYALVLARGKQEVIVAKGSKDKMKEKYINLNKKRVYDPSLFATMWGYATTKQRLELRDAQ